VTAEAAYRRLETAVGDRDAPLAVVDLGALQANATALVAQAGGLPVRVASKSVRCVEVLRRVLAMPGWQGVLAFTPAEACHLAAAGIDDLLVAYPSVDRGALRAVARRVADGRPERIVLMVDSVEGAALVAMAAREAGVGSPWRSTSTRRCGRCAGSPSACCGHPSVRRVRLPPWPARWRPTRTSTWSP
jgi:D-serine deaminase-like pyridoxal phosphate-dependent protein